MPYRMNKTSSLHYLHVFAMDIQNLVQYRPHDQNYRFSVIQHWPPAKQQAAVYAGLKLWQYHPGFL